MGVLRATESCVIIQVIENLLEDCVRTNSGEDGNIANDVLINTIKATIMVFMNTVKEAATSSFLNTKTK